MPFRRRPPANDNQVKLVLVTTIPDTLFSMSGQAPYLRARGFDVYAMASPGPRLDDFAASDGATTFGVPMRRSVTPLHDLGAVIRIWRHVWRLRPTIVHANTPKGGLLGVVGARLAGVPIRIYHVHGLRYVTTQGAKRAALRWSEKTACRLANQVLCVSESVRQEMIDDGLVPADKIKVLRSGSINGVDADGSFNPIATRDARGPIRAQHGIPDNALVVSFIGRIVRDKGMVELAEAWTALRDERPDLHLMVVGPFEPEDPVPADVAALFHRDPRVHLTGEVYDTAPLFAATDVFVLPTYREGLPTVLLEAAAMEAPVVATCVPGCVDAVDDGVTGILVPVHDGRALADAIRRYLDDPALRRAHGRAARERVLRDFRPDVIWEALYDEYARLLREHGLAAPGPTIEPGSPTAPSTR